MRGKCLCWTVSAQAAFFASSKSLLSFKDKEIRNHRAHLRAGVNASKRTGTGNVRTALARARGWQINAHSYLKIFVVYGTFTVYVVIIAY